jgi:hypothetical protein
MKTELEILGSKRLRAVTLRRGGMTYREIGEKIGVGPQRASQIVAIGERKLRLREAGVDAVELGVRAGNCLNNAGIGSSRKSVREAIDSGVLHPNKSGTMTAMRELNEPELLEWDDGYSFRPRSEKPYYLRNYGWKTHEICCEYAGIPCRRGELFPSLVALARAMERLERLKAEVKRLEEKIEASSQSPVIDKNISQSERQNNE